MEMQVEAERKRRAQVLESEPSRDPRDSNDVHVLLLLMLRTTSCFMWYQLRVMELNIV
ncbi:hypothetical protein ACS0TY_010851 [Phlomoides rotata]